MLNKDESGLLKMGKIIVVIIIIIIINSIMNSDNQR